MLAKQWPLNIVTSDQRVRFMAGSRENPYSYFNANVSGIRPEDYWNIATAQPFTAPQYGVDTGTGKRDTKKVSEALAVNPFGTGEELYQFGQPPSYTVGDLPEGADPYMKYADKLSKKLFESEAKQQLLGLGSGLAFSAASLPFAERLRNVDYQLGLQADVNSPTRIAARDASRQQQAIGAKNAEADYLRALAAVRQGAVAGVNVNVQ